MSGRYLIVNADDLGQSEGVNRGVAVAADHGIVTSASLMVRWPAAPAACGDAARSNLDLGLHVDLGEWAFWDGQWSAVYQVVDVGDHRAVRDEVRRQWSAFVDLTGGPPSHIDSHQHVHQRHPARGVFEELADEFGVPVRGWDGGLPYCGAFYGQTAEGQPLAGNITVEALVGLLEGLTTGVTELGCHPAAADDLHTMYRAERLEELATLCDRRVLDALKSCGITLCSFRTRPRGGRTPGGR